MALSLFVVVCILHSAIALTTGVLMVFFMEEIYTFTHGTVAAKKMLGSTPEAQLLIRTSDSFSGLLLFAIGLLLFMVAFVKDRDFQSFFAKGCVLLHVSMAIWRFNFERRVEDLAWDWLRQIVGDILLALSWVFFLVYSWKVKYD
ncbi:uncharacterized protein LOC127795819 [Diospyros lotus]|uniref:uncharacterized protein LOC127795819 n=1 Tax=Diospyros lotus TaxID=55363 RepID=UPI0022554BAA|nr:uncharacterized protein LOC127795819 [Diospyros lotus]